MLTSYSISEFVALVVTQWTIQLTSAFKTMREWYEKKRPAELAAVLNNFKRYHFQLVKSKNALCVQAGYIHTEGKGVIALDESAGGGNIQATRLYIFPEESTRTLHLITIGNKDSQPRDIKLSHSYVDSLTPKT